MKIRDQIETLSQGALGGVRSLATRVEPVLVPALQAPFQTLEIVATQGAKRFKAAGEATSFDALIQGQLALLPETKAVALGESRKYLERFFSAKAKADAAFKAKVMGWVTPKAPKARKAAAAVEASVESPVAA